MTVILDLTPGGGGAYPEIQMQKVLVGPTHSLADADPRYAVQAADKLLFSCSGQKFISPFSPWDLNLSARKCYAGGFHDARNSLVKASTAKTCWLSVICVRGTGHTGWNV